jgi:hypothetical protein
MTVRWDELTEEERVALVALSQSPVLTLTVAMAARLEVLGLAQPDLAEASSVLRDAS